MACSLPSRQIRKPAKLLQFATQGVDHRSTCSRRTVGLPASSTTKRTPTPAAIQGRRDLAWLFLQSLTW